MDRSHIKELDAQYIVHTYNRYDVVVDHACGAVVTDADGKEYIPQNGDSLRFAMARSYDGRVIVKKSIAMDTLLLTIDPADTKKLSFGQYVYDIQFTSASGDVSTIAMGSFHVTKEVA